MVNDTLQPRCPPSPLSADPIVEPLSEEPLLAEWRVADKPSRYKPKLDLLASTRQISNCPDISAKDAATRRLGAHINVQLDTTVLMIATGCKLQIVGDLLRRPVMCTIGTGNIANKDRVHTFAPVDQVAANPPQLVVDALTIIRAWLAAGMPLLAAYKSMLIL
jgi:hypothetical protein